MMGSPMASERVQQSRITILAGLVLCRCWLYMMGEVTARNRSRLMATRWKMEEVEQTTSMAR